MQLTKGVVFKTARYEGTVLEVASDWIVFKENGSKAYVRKASPDAFRRGIANGQIQLVDPAEEILEDMEAF